MRMMSERTSITDGPLGFEIVVRPRRDWGLRLFMPVWLLGWTAGEVAAFYTVFTAIFGGPRPFAGPVGFIAPWLVFWTVGGAIAWMVFAYNIAGRERVSIDGTWITTSRELFRWARSVRMPLADIRRMRFSPPVNSRNSWSSALQQWGLGDGSVAFEAEGKTRRFGSSLTEDETSELIEQIQQRFPIPP